MRLSTTLCSTGTQLTAYHEGVVARKKGEQLKSVWLELRRSHIIIAFLETYATNAKIIAKACLFFDFTSSANIHMFSND